jgi:hypothetical protein
LKKPPKKWVQKMTRFLINFWSIFENFPSKTFQKCSKSVKIPPGLLLRKIGKFSTQFRGIFKIVQNRPKIDPKMTDFLMNFYWIFWSKKWVFRTKILIFLCLLRKYPLANFFKNVSKNGPKSVKNGWKTVIFGNFHLES